MTVNAIGCGFDPHLMKLNIYLNLYFHFFALVSRQHAALSSAAQHAFLLSSSESGEWNGLTQLLLSAYLAVGGILREADDFFI